MKNWKKRKANMEKNMCVSFEIMPKKKKKENRVAIYFINVARSF